MPLTKNHEFYAGISQAAVQKIFNKLRSARPRYFKYSSLGIGGVGGATIVQPIPIPGTNQQVDYSINLDTPVVFFDPNPFNPVSPKAAQIGLGEFGLYLKVETCLITGSSSAPNSICGQLEVWAVGHLETTSLGSTRVVMLVLESVEVAGAGSFSALFEHVLLLLLNSILSKTSLPLEAVGQTSLPFNLAQGPSISGGSMEIWGDLR
ncbi:hypothetical protein [Rhizobium leguminosarum]|uniref:hypothetical protein n=1 Tax=Rhizobium leguminosarum TaxID=384 RepID=UPI0013DA6CBF|nr:hypothetical protein [Rhizobium leguminosarum]NEK35064.1 hypothetical protein [Rhizobium leguminosarum]